jgi:hypothetical protein
MVCAAKPPPKNQRDTSVRLEVDSLHCLLSHPFIFPHAALTVTLHFWAELLQPQKADLNLDVDGSKELIEDDPFAEDVNDSNSLKTCLPTRWRSSKASLLTMIQSLQHLPVSPLPIWPTICTLFSKIRLSVVMIEGPANKL